jgi:hypothetical protein
MHRRHPGAVAIITVVVLALLWSLPWRRCQCRLGIGALATLASLGTLPWHHCQGCCCGASVIVALAHRGTGIITDVALATLGHCCRCNADVIADVALAPLPLLLLRCWLHCGAGIIMPRRPLGIIAITALMPGEGIEDMISGRKEGTTSGQAIKILAWGGMPAPRHPPCRNEYTRVFNMQWGGYPQMGIYGKAREPGA